MVERLGEKRKGRRERIEKGSREGIEKETKRQFEEGLRDQASNSGILEEEDKAILLRLIVHGNDKIYNFLLIRLCSNSSRLFRTPNLLLYSFTN